MADALQFRGVHKRYGRGVKALDNLDFRIPTGVIAGFVGPNGAGKTTTYSVVSGFLQPDAGEVDILGTGPFDPKTLKNRLGVLPQDAALPDRHSPIELLTHLARLQGMSRRQATAEAERVVNVVRLSDQATSRINTLSHGMRRRVAVASALCGGPELILLDEPLAGLDPGQAHSLREVLASLRGKHTLVVSSHILADLERLSDWVVMVAKGRLLRQGPLSEVTEQSRVVRWELGPGAVPLDQLRRALVGHQFTVNADAVVQSAPADSDLDAASVVVMRILADAGIALRGHQRGVALEERFLADEGSS